MSAVADDDWARSATITVFWRNAVWRSLNRGSVSDHCVAHQAGKLHPALLTRPGESRTLRERCFRPGRVSVSTGHRVAGSRLITQRGMWRHSALGMISPVEYENRFTQTAQAA